MDENGDGEFEFSGYPDGETRAATEFLELRGRWWKPSYSKGILLLVPAEIRKASLAIDGLPRPVDGASGVEEAAGQRTIFEDRIQADAAAQQVPTVTFSD